MSLPLKLYKSQKEHLIEYYYAELQKELPHNRLGDFTLDECRNRFQAGLCYTLMLEVVGQSLADEKELANEVTQSKRHLIFQRILSALGEIEQPTIFFNIHKGRRATGSAEAVTTAPKLVAVPLLATDSEA